MLYRVDPLLTPIRVPSHAVCGPSHAPLPGEFAGELGFVGQPESLIDRRHRLDVFPERPWPLGNPFRPYIAFGAQRARWAARPEVHVQGSRVTTSPPKDQPRLRAFSP